MMDIKEYIHSGDVIAKRIGNALFGEGKEPTDCDDLFKLAEKCANDGKKLPEIYRGMKNNLTVNNNNEIRKMNENIANTGNHTASGYAISKRLNNINDYNIFKRI